MTSRTPRPPRPFTTDFQFGKTIPSVSAHRNTRRRMRAHPKPAANLGNQTTSLARETLAFAMQWRHWGGGQAEDIFVQFGLTTHEFFQRVRKLLSTPAAAGMSIDDKAHLRQICATRLNGSSC